MHRRRFLAATALSLGLAGCSTESDPEATTLGSVTLANRDDEPHAVDFRVEWDGDIVHDRTYELPASDATGNTPGRVPERTWPGEPGQFRVLARLDGGEWRTADPADSDYPDCLGVYVGIDPRGHVAMYTSTDSYECSDEAISSGRSSTESST